MSQQLTEHFQIDELTVTSNAALQAANRVLTDDQIAKLGVLAQHLETIRALCGNTPLNVHSAYRSDAVNGATRGASSTSQHPKCEAADFDVPGQTIDATFLTLLTAARAGTFRFGQLIIEEADRGYKNADGTESISRWVHCSVIGTLNPDHVGQVMKADWNEAEGKFDYTLIDRIKFS
jgi:hypothetical protein